MSKHTPGPWEYMRAQNYSGFAIAPKGILPTLAAVREVAMPAGHIDITCFNFPGRTEANARLIAAAPELLHELQHLVRLIEPVIGSAGIPGLATLNAARAAIARATGESE